MYNYILHDYFFMKTYRGNKAGPEGHCSVHLPALLICKHLHHPPDVSFILPNPEKRLETAEMLKCDRRNSIVKLFRHLFTNYLGAECLPGD